MNKNEKKKIAIIGGSGKVGTFLVRQCIDNNIKIRLLLRSPERFHLQNSLIEIVKGDARNIDCINELVTGCTCVINAVSTPKGEKPFFSQMTQNLLHAMSQSSIKRYILVTGLVIDVPGDKKGVSTRMKSALMKFIFPEIIAEKAEDYRLLSQSELEWTVVRIPYLDLKKKSGKTYVNLKDCKGRSISGEDLADFLINQIDREEFIKKAPFLSN
ncbi:MAG: NAD(P)H-binding protein [Spirochaetes bacterium]|nr:NAD(P)H-binding protein [Spirochaetota bacterium]